MLKLFQKLDNILFLILIEVAPSVEITKAKEKWGGL